MNAGLTRWLLRCFPASWRAEYGLEFEDLLRQQPFRLRDVANVLVSAGREQVRRPVIRTCLALVLVNSGLFLLGLMLCSIIWQAVSSPVVMVLRTHGIRPAALISVTPCEGWRVIWLGVPMLFTILGAYPCLLVLGSMFADRRQGKGNGFALSSGAVYLGSLMVGLVLWRQGLPLGMLLDHALASPNPPINPMISVEEFFILLVCWALGWTVAWQVPVFLILRWRWNSPTTPG